MNQMIEFLKRLFFPTKYYEKRLDVLYKRFLEETEKDKLLASFANFLLPLHLYFSENGLEDKWAIVNKSKFNEVYKMGIDYYMGMKIIWK